MVIIVLALGTGAFNFTKAVQSARAENSFTQATSDFSQYTDKEALVPQNLCSKNDVQGLAEFIEIERCVEEKAPNFFDIKCRNESYPTCDGDGFF